MAEILKACTQHDSSSSSLATKLAPQMAGFLSVLAISGSVAFISLMGKAKLLRQGGRTSHSQGDFEEEEEEEEDEDRSHSQEDYNEEKLLTHSHLYSFCEEYEHSPPHLKSLHEGIEPTSATLKRKKKVRFASDVVEPPCNGQQYRSKWRVSQGCEKHEPPCNNDQVFESPLNHHQHYKSKRRVSHRFGVNGPTRNDHIDVNDPPSDNDQQCTSTHNVSQGYTTHARLAHHKIPYKSCKASQGWEMLQVPSKSPSSMPANRLALYKGLRQSRLQHSRHYS